MGFDNYYSAVGGNSMGDNLSEFEGVAESVAGILLWKIGVLAPGLLLLLPVEEDWFLRGGVDSIVWIITDWTFSSPALLVTLSIIVSLLVGLLIG